jgi:pantoate--beta-alanine ligase
MQISKHINSMQQELAALTMQGESLALVPTMGNLHAGHMSLVREARKLADRVVVSIFVNPAQFDRDEDLAAYPRTLDEDVAKLEKGRVDLLFVPHSEEIYGPESTTRIHLAGLADRLEGASRPGHFDGVATIVAKLFNLIQPDVALFGEKDFQQLLVIRRMVEDLNFPVSVMGLPTVREADGLAMSSRNGYLDDEERQRAPRLYACLQEMERALRQGQKDYSGLEQQAMADLENTGFRVDYVSIMAANDLKSPQVDEEELVILASAWLGKARLIDNIPVDLAAS